VAFTLSFNDGKLEAKRLWEGRPRGRDYFASPVIYKGLVYTVNSKEDLYVLDAQTGERVYKERLKLSRGTAYPSPCFAGGHLYISGADERKHKGVTLVIEPGKAYTEIAKNDLGEDFRSTPLFEDNKIYIRAMKHLYCIGE